MNLASQETPLTFARSLALLHGSFISPSNSQIPPFTFTESSVNFLLIVSWLLSLSKYTHFPSNMGLASIRILKGYCAAPRREERHKTRRTIHFSFDLKKLMVFILGLLGFVKVLHIQSTTSDNQLLYTKRQSNTTQRSWIHCRGLTLKSESRNKIKFWRSIIRIRIH